MHDAGIDALADTDAAATMHRKTAVTVTTARKRSLRRGKTGPAAA